MGKREPLFWFSTIINGRRWDVYLSAASITRDLAEGGATQDRCDGITDASIHRVWVDAGQSSTKIDSTTLHELLHVCLATSYVWPAERLVTALEEPLFRLVTAFGFAFPPKPDGWRSLQRYARKCDPSDLGKGT